MHITGRSGPKADRGRLTGAARLLVVVYGVLALAATARSLFQIATKFSEAPLAFLLSLVAALVYVLATVSFAIGGTKWLRVAFGTVCFELLGVLVVGVFTLVDPAAFPDSTVWSGFGAGYGYVPLILPIIGLVWLVRHRDAWLWRA